MKKNFKKVVKIIGLVLFIGMLVVIFEVSPRIAQAILDADKMIITRVIEIVLSTSLVLLVTVPMNKKK
jgi:uncharacterized membrane protein YozB (DUF420 family)